VTTTATTATTADLASRPEMIEAWEQAKTYARLHATAERSTGWGENLYGAAVVLGLVLGQTTNEVLVQMYQAAEDSLSREAAYWGREAGREHAAWAAKAAEGAAEAARLAKTFAAS
jgi:hypothetical protein